MRRTAVGLADNITGIVISIAVERFSRAVFHLGELVKVIVLITVGLAADLFARYVPVCVVGILLREVALGKSSSDFTQKATEYRDNS